MGKLLNRLLDQGALSGARSTRPNCLIGRPAHTRNHRAVPDDHDDHDDDDDDADDDHDHD